MLDIVSLPRFSAVLHGLKQFVKQRLLPSGVYHTPCVTFVHNCRSLDALPMYCACYSAVTGFIICTLLETDKQSVNSGL
jgi:hypothetical protein